MFGRSKTDKAKGSAGFAAALAKDRKFRKELLSALGHGTLAQRRAARKIGFFATARRLNADPKIRRELKRMVTSLEKAWTRVEKKRSHKRRNLLLLVGIGGAAAAASKPEVRSKVTGALPGKTLGGGTTPRTIEQSIEVNVPV